MNNGISRQRWTLKCRQKHTYISLPYTTAIFWSIFKLLTMSATQRQNNDRIKIRRHLTYADEGCALCMTS